MKMEAKVHHVAFVTAREYVKDGYHLVDYGFNEQMAESRYNLCHDNGNQITVVGVELTNKVEVYKNRKLNKTIQLKK